jgi:hypothetical protein
MPDGIGLNVAAKADRERGLPQARALELAAFGLVVAQLAYLVAVYFKGQWLLQADGGVVSDFVDFWSAGYQVLHARAVDAYNPALNVAAQKIAVGHPFDGGYPFFYPPTFLFPAAILALFPYAVAHLGWSLATFAAYAASIRSIVGFRFGLLLAAAFPAVLANFASGQNGLLAAALIAGALGFMERRPVLAGCLLGLLTFKPQLGILFPLILAIDGRWRMFFAAAVTVVFLFAASALAFGFDTWVAFFHSLPDYSRVHLREGEEYWMKMQSVFTLVRLLGGSETLAWIFHGTFIGAIAISLCVLWRSAASFDMKAAALALGSLLVSPYLFLYDFAVLAVPLAFLLHEARMTGFLPYELAGIAATCFLILIFPLVMAPVGLAAAFIVLALILRRIAPTENAR